MIKWKFCDIEIKMLLKAMNIHQMVRFHQTRDLYGKIVSSWETTFQRVVKDKSVVANYGSLPTKCMSSVTYFYNQYLHFFLLSKFKTNTIQCVPVLLRNDNLLRPYVCGKDIQSHFIHTKAHHSALKSDHNMKSSKEPEDNLILGRIIFLSRILTLSLGETKNIVSKYSFFLHLDPELILEKISVIQSYDLPLSFIGKNPRLLYHHSSDELKRRLQLLKEAALLCENPIIQQQDLAHYLECPYKIFHSSFQRLCAERDALEGYSSQKDYLQFRLQCSKERAETLMSQYPLKGVISNVKVKQFLDFMLNEAMLSPAFVIQHKQLLGYSVQRLRFRLNVMQAAGVSTPEEMAHVWNMTEVKFTAEFKAYI